MTRDFKEIPLKEFHLGKVELIKYDYDNEGLGREKKIAIRNIDCIIYDFRIDSDTVPNGWNKYEIRGVDWSSDDDARTLLRDCRKYGHLIVPNHLTISEYNEYIDKLECNEESSAFYDLREALSYAMSDICSYELEGFDMSMREGIMVDFYCTVLMKENINDIRNELGLSVERMDEVDVDVLHNTYNAEESAMAFWNEFKTTKE